MPTTQLSGIRHLAYGDSVTSGENNFGKPVTQILTNRLGTVSYNVGIGGTCFARGPNEIYDPLSMYELCKAKINNAWVAQDAAVNTFQPAAKDYYTTVLSIMKSVPLNAPTMASTNLLTIAFGVNDFLSNRPIGTDTDDTKETFKGALNHVLSRFQSNYGRIKIMLSTPVWCVGAETANTAGHKLIDYADATLRIGEIRSVPVLDLYRNSGINADNAGTLLIDGLHPNADGYQVLGNIWASALLSRL